MRAHEVRQLCGQPDRLNTLLRQQGIEPRQPTLRSTLVRMLAAMNPLTGQWQAHGPRP
jgi:hypothetical protein